jgi:hypothetical protein
MTTKKKSSSTKTKKQHCLSPKEFRQYYQWIFEKSKDKPKKERCITLKEYKAFLEGKGRRKVRDGFFATANF